MMNPQDVCLMYPPVSVVVATTVAPPPGVVVVDQATPAFIVGAGPNGDILSVGGIAAVGDLYGAAASSFAVAPGAEHSAQKLQLQCTNNGVATHGPQQPIDSQKKLVMDYESDFPTLSPNDPAETVVAQSTWNAKRTNKTLPVKANTATQVFNLPAEERRYLNAHDQSFGDNSQEQDECNMIMQKTGTSIELCQNKDHSLTIVVSGKRANVEEARKLIVQSLQTQCHREIRIPKDHHRALIGREGRKLQQLEKETDCRIIIPNRDVPSDVIKVVGPRDGIDKAMHQIQLISDEQSKLAQEHLTIPKIFYPWIKGPYNETVDAITQETGARINIPPSTAASDIIVVTGEKEGVHRAVAIIKQIYDEKKNSSTVSIQVEKSQHRFIIGPQRSGLAEILKETGVSVEVPPEEADSNLITLRGDQAKLAAGLGMVYAKASSVISAEVSCPTWLHKYVIGPKGSGIRQIVGEDSNNGKVQVSFEEEGRIFLEGPPAEVKRIRDSLANIVRDLQADYTFEILHINPQYHRHIIGKSGANISKIRQETGASVSIPSDDSHSDEVRIEGRRVGVAQAKTEITEMVKKMENEKSRDIIIENRFHRIIIGAKGESVKELREKYPGVLLQFPEPGRKTDVVTLRGPKDEVDKCYKHLQSVVKELLENNYQERVPIFKEFHPHLIGKGGANIKKIRDETDTKIELPVENSPTDVITITGKKANVEKARDMLRKLEGEFTSVVTSDVSIPHKLHSRLIGGNWRMIQHIAQTECGGVQIKFPSEKLQSDKITIRGPQEGVEKAKKMLLDLAKDREISMHQAEIKVKPDLFRFLIGRGGSKIHKIREANPNVRIMLPRPDDEDQETIHLMGKREDVDACKGQIEGVLSDLSHSVEVRLEVDAKWHRHFVGRGAMIIREIQDHCGGVMVSFPKQGSDSNTVVIKGGKECAESAKKRIEEIVDDLNSAVTIKANIPQRYHGLLLANRGAKIQEITHRCNVQIKFPERNRQQQFNDNQSQQGSPLASGHVNGSATPENLTNGNNGSAEDEDYVDPHDVVTIIGRLEKCQEAKELMLAEIPITEHINVPFDFHRNLIGRNGVEIRKLMDRFQVSIRVPPQDEQSDEIGVTGTSENVKLAKEAILARLDELEAEAKDRALKSYRVAVQVPQEYHPKLIGTKGSEINRLRSKYDVQITIPVKNGENSADDIIITGYEKNANECKEEIEKTVAEFQSFFNLEITLDCRVHSRIIGQKGKNIRKMMDDFKVEIRFPRSTDKDPNLVVISGKNEDAVYDCADHLHNLEEEYLQDISDRRRDPVRLDSEHFDNGSTTAARGAAFAVEIHGKTPWAATPGQAVPDMADMNDFPAMGVAAAQETARPSTHSKWGPAPKGY